MEDITAIRYMIDNLNIEINTETVGSKGFYHQEITVKLKIGDVVISESKTEICEE